MKQYLAKILTVSLIVMVSVAYAEISWTENWEEAKKQAAKENKYMLVNFTGSDWCGWCIKLEKEVFGQEKFTEASKKFVFVKLDFPRDKSKMSEETKKQNDELKKKYKITGYPSIFLMDAKGVIFAKTGYKSGGPEAYIKNLNTLIAGKVKLEKVQVELKGLTGIERAKKLDSLIAIIFDASVKSKYMAEIIKLDADNKAGLKAKYEFVVIEEKLTTLFRSRKAVEALALCDKLLKKDSFTKDQVQTLLFNKSQALFFTQKKDEAKAILIEARDINPNSRIGKQVDGILKRFFPAKK